MQPYELEAWLGDENTLTEQQFTELLRIAHDIETRYPDPDHEDERTAALVAAHRLIVEDEETVIADYAAQLRAARAAETAALAALRQASLTLITTSSKGARGLRTQQGFARAAGVDRAAVRDWLNP